MKHDHVSSSMTSTYEYKVQRGIDARYLAGTMLIVACREHKQRYGYCVCVVDAPALVRFGSARLSDGFRFLSFRLMRTHCGPPSTDELMGCVWDKPVKPTHRCDERQASKGDQRAQPPRYEDGGDPARFDAAIASATDHTPRFSLTGLRLCKVTSVYDGDTVTVVLRVDDRLCKFNVRLFGIDTPELRSRSEEERACAVECREQMRSWAQDRVLWLRCHEQHDKYGRLLGTIIAKRDAHGTVVDVSPHDEVPHGVAETSDRWMVVNREMLRMPGVSAYDGGAKLPFQDRS